MKLSVKIAAILLCAAVILPLAGCKEDSDKIPSNTFDRSYSDYNLDEYVKLPEYKGLKVTLDSPDVTDDMVEQHINNLINAYATTEVRESGTVEEGTLININCMAELDGAIDEMLSEEDATILIGSTSYIDIEGFDEGLIGKEVGDEVTLELKFPEDYPDEQYAGKDITFIIAINHILDVIYPEFNEEFLAIVSETHKTPDEYRSYIRSALTAQAEALNQDEKYNIVWEMVLENSEIIKYPEAELLNYKQDFIDYYTEAAADSGTTLEDFLMANFGREYAEFETDALSYAYDYVKNDLVFRAIVEKENLEIDESEYAEGLAMYYSAAQGSFESEEDFVTYYGEDFIRDNLLWQEMITMLADSADVTYN